MSKIISGACAVCGCTDPHKFKLYEGLLGYEAIICLECGWTADRAGYHPPADPGKFRTRTKQYKDALNEIGAGQLDDEPDHRFITRARRVAKEALGQPV